MTLRRLFQYLECRTQFLTHICRYNLNPCCPNVAIQFGWSLYPLVCSFSLMDATAFAFCESMSGNHRIIYTWFRGSRDCPHPPPIVYLSGGLRVFDNVYCSNTYQFIISLRIHSEKMVKQSLDSPFSLKLLVGILNSTVSTEYFGKHCIFL
jgi:hypothetical protein